MKGIKLLLGLIILTFIGILIFIQGHLLSVKNIDEADKTMSNLLNQVESVINQNEESINTLTKTLKEEYIIRCRAVAYTISSSKNQADLEELQKIANLTLVDEIHLFSTKGVLFNGTNPEYYGMDILSYSPDEQISFFRPILTDQSLELCQDVMENTAPEQRKMMYAMVWSENKDFLVQIGISPTRLLNEMNASNANTIINSMPMIDGINVYLSNKSGEIIGTTNQNAINMNILDICKDKSASHWNKYHNETLFNEDVRCIFKSKTNYDIGVTYSLSKINDGLFQILFFTTSYLIISGASIFIILHIHLNKTRRSALEISKSKDALNEQYKILFSLSEVYHSMHLIDLDNDKAQTYRTTNNIESHINGAYSNTEIMYNIINARCDKSFKDDIIKFTNLSAIKERLKGRKIISTEFLTVEGVWLQASFISIEEKNGEPSIIFFTTRCINEEKRREFDLITKSTTDELTGLYNRRKYEEDLQKLQDEIPNNLTIISMDVNGLKKINDFKGHIAGDELIRLSAKSMKEAFKAYGSIYRTGGDEFVAILRINTILLNQQIEKFNTIIETTHGVLVDKISVSLGFVEYKNHQNSSLRELEKIADEEMYKNKQEYYNKLNK